MYKIEVVHICNLYVLNPLIIKKKFKKLHYLKKITLILKRRKKFRNFFVRLTPSHLGPTSLVTCPVKKNQFSLF